MLILFYLSILYKLKKLGKISSKSIIKMNWFLFFIVGFVGSIYQKIRQLLNYSCLKMYYYTKKDNNKLYFNISGYVTFKFKTLKKQLLKLVSEKLNFLILTLNR